MATGYEQILYTVEGHVAVVTLNRPDRLNAWTGVMSGEVRDAMTRASADEGVRVILLTGAGRGFCAGADMSSLEGIVGGESATGANSGRGATEEMAAFTRTGRRDFQQPFTWFPSVPKPIVAAINGPCAGMGFVLSMFSDLRVMAAGARMGSAFARRGLIAEHGISWILPRLVGPARALDLLMTARMVPADEALALGLVNRVLPDEDFRAAALAVAEELGTLSSPRSISIIKRQVWDALFQDLDEATRAANEEMYKCFDTEDFREGVAHFVEKRAPRFTGR